MNILFFITEDTEMHTREEYLQELDEVCALPEDQQRDAYEEFQDKWNTIIDPTWPSIKARLPKIDELIVKGTDLTLGELCQREHWDWRPLPPKLR